MKLLQWKENAHKLQVKIRIKRMKKKERRKTVISKILIFDDIPTIWQEDSGPKGGTLYLGKKKKENTQFLLFLFILLSKKNKNWNAWKLNLFSFSLNKFKWLTIKNM